MGDLRHFTSFLCRKISPFERVTLAASAVLQAARGYTVGANPVFALWWATTEGCPYNILSCALHLRPNQFVKYAG